MTAVPGAPGSAKPAAHRALGQALAQAHALLSEAAAPVATPDDPRVVAWALKELCLAAWIGNPPRAARAAEALEALSQAGVPPQQARTVQSLSEWTAGIACLTRGQMAEAVQALDRAADGLRACGLPDAAAQTQVSKIMALSMLGALEQATACALSAQRELLSLGNRGAAARVSQNLGNLQMLRDDYPAAARHFREAAVLFARMQDHAHSVLADIGAAAAMASQGDFDEALRVYARARMRAEHRGLTLPLAQVDESVALLDLARGRYRPALAGFESARRRYESLGVPQYLAIAEKQLGDAYLELRLLPEALALQDAAVRQFEQLGLPLEQAWALAQRGRAQALLGQPAAADSFAQAARLFEMQGHAVGASAVALARAELALDAGQLPAALACAQQAVDGFAAAGQAEGMARGEVVLAQAWLRSGRIQDAADRFEATLARSFELQQRAVQVRCQTGLGQTALAQGRAAQSRACFEAAIEGFEEQRRALPGDDLRGAFLTEHLQPYTELLRMALAGGAGAEVLWHLDRFRARTLDDRLAEREADDLPPDPDAEPLRERLNWLYRRAQRLQEDQADSPWLTDELRRTEQALLERSRRRRLTAAEAPAQADAKAADESVHAQHVPLLEGALRTALQPGDALVEYGALDEELFACVVRPEGTQLIRGLASWPEVLQTLRSTLFQLETLRHGAAPVRQHLDRLQARAQARLSQLYGQVWAPLAELLAPCRRVMVVPHAQLGALPFAALHDGHGALGQRHQLAVAPSARAALRGLARRPAPSIAFMMVCKHSWLLLKLGAKPPSSPTVVGIP